MGEAQSRRVERLSLEIQTVEQLAVFRPDPHFLGPQEPGVRRALADAARSGTPD